LVLYATAAMALPAQTFTWLFSFDGTDGAGPWAGLAQGTDGDLYGTTEYGGANGSTGTIFKITPSGTLTTLHIFCSQSGCADGELPYAGLAQATNGDFYGTTGWGGANDGGTVFKITLGGTLTTLYSFCSQSGCANGELPYAGLAQATNGDFYGTTEWGGANNGGTVFKITPAGALTTLYNFCSESGCPGGGWPYAGLVQATNGDFYGTTSGGGANSEGTVFKITPGGTLTTLYSFCSQSNCTDGGRPTAGLVQATNEDLYGTTSNGGANNGGTVFRITPSGTLTTAYTFCSLSGCTDGANPTAGLVQATNGDLYGTTPGGGNIGGGTVFKMTPTGTLTTLYSFSCSGSGCAGGSGPDAGLIQGSDGNFYGTTEWGGANGYGTVFQITPRGALTTLHDFCPQTGCADGANPRAGLVQATDGDFYGTTSVGGANCGVAGGCGTIFKVTSSGAFTTLYDFSGSYFPYAGLVQDTNGSFYGTTNSGGGGGGTVFRLSMGLGPFIKTLPTSGKVGSAVKILGTDLTGATGVTFNGAAAVFNVASSSQITTTVPTGATTGTVQVVTPSGTLSSNVTFRVP
jgi:uncharacterized repeat protein (TIGR03803 family)